MKGRAGWLLVVGVVCASLLAACTSTAQRPQQETEAGSSLAPYTSFQQLLDASQAVVTVTVLSSKAAFDEADQAVYTISDARVDTSFVGDIKPGTVIPLRIRGGKADGKETAVMSLDPVFEPNSQHLLFLKRYVSDKRPELNGWYLVSGFQSRAEIGADGKLKLIPSGLPNPLKEWEAKPFGEIEKAIIQAKPEATGG